MKSEFKTAMDVKATVYATNAKRIESELANYLTEQANRLSGTKVYFGVDNGFAYLGDDADKHHSISMSTPENLKGAVLITIFCGGYRCGAQFAVNGDSLVLYEKGKSFSARISDAKYTEQFIAFLKDWEMLKKKLAREIDEMCQAQFDDAMFLGNFKV